MTGWRRSSAKRITGIPALFRVSPTATGCAEGPYRALSATGRAQEHGSLVRADLRAFGPSEED